MSANHNPPTPQEKLELVLVNRNIVDGFSFGYRASGQRCGYVLEDRRANIVFVRSSLTELVPIYKARLALTMVGTTRDMLNKAEVLKEMLRKRLDENPPEIA